MKKHISAVDRSTGAWKYIAPIFVGAFAIFAALPFWIAIQASFSDSNTLLNEGFALYPRGFTTLAYEYIFGFSYMIIDSYRTSIIMALFGTILSMILSILIAYPLSDLTFRYRSIISLILFISMVFSGGLLPYYYLVSQVMNLSDTIFPLFLPGLALPYHIFLLRIFMQEIPRELYESAKLDGAGEYTQLFGLTVPLIKPGLATVCLFIVMLYWNDIFTAQLFISSERQDLYPLQYLLYNFNEYIRALQSNEGIIGGDVSKIPSETMVYALCIVAAGPMTVIFLFFQRYFVSGLSMGALKN